MYEHDERIVMTLDAGGTNFVFSAIQGCREIIEPVHYPAVADDLVQCLNLLVEGFTEVVNRLNKFPVAISFAFPGPADYEHGIIGDLPNFPAFRGGVALGPFLSEHFDVPVFINNDGNLFTYGEALAGVLPQINRSLREAGSSRVYKNLLGITLGTGFGGGVVINRRLLKGDNDCGGDVWLMSNRKYPEMIAEEGVSIRAVRRVYQALSSEDASALSPKDVFDIAEGVKCGDREAAVACFRELGEIAGDAIVHALDIVDGLVVIGGGVAGAVKYILPGMMSEFRRQAYTFSGASFPCLQMEVFDLTDADGFARFVTEENGTVQVPFSEKRVPYVRCRKTGIAISALGADKAIALGAYLFALSQLDNIR